MFSNLVDQYVVFVIHSLRYCCICCHVSIDSNQAAYRTNGGLTGECVRMEVEIVWVCVGITYCL